MRVEDQPTSLSTALKRPLPVLVVHLGAAAFLNPPNLFSVLLLIVSALSLGASPSMTKTSFTPIRVRDDTLKNKFLHTHTYTNKIALITTIRTVVLDTMRNGLTNKYVTITWGGAWWLSPSSLGHAGPRTPTNSGQLPASFRSNCTAAPTHEPARR